jgi:hypothetical protein
VPALRPAERPRRVPRRPGWILHTLQFPAPLRLYRITRVVYPDPAYYGRGRLFRFDAPDASYGVCHFGTSLAAALIEAVPLALVAASGERLVEASDLRTRYASRATSVEPLELAAVFVTGLEEGLFPHARAASAGANAGEEPEERRLTYVALSRCQVLLYLTYCRSRTLDRIDGECRREPRRPSRYPARTPCRVHRTCGLSRAEVPFTSGRMSRREV